MQVPNLRSPHEKLGGIVYFARMLDKIRLHAAGQLPADYVGNLGGGFDERCCHFLWIEYPALVAYVKGGADDEAALAWAFQQGRKPSEEEIEVWNEFMRKRGWNDAGTPTLERRKREGNIENRHDVVTFFDFIDVDEGRAPKQG